MPLSGISVDRYRGLWEVATVRESEIRKVRSVL